MNRLPKELENPIDRNIRNITDNIAKFLTKYNFNPAIITTIGNIWSYLAIKFIRENDENFNKNRIILLLVLRLFTDYLYDSMTYYYYLPSRFNKWYQCISSHLFVIIILGFILYRTGNIYQIILSLLMMGLFIYNLYEVDKYKKLEKHQDYGYDIDEKFKDKMKKKEKIMKYTKFFSYSTIIIYTIIILYIYKS
jgi:hypothetical protein